MSLRLAGAWALTVFVCLAVSSAASAAGGGVPYVSGYNEYHELGDGSLSGEDRYVPEMLSGLPGVVSASSSEYTTLVLLANGGVYGWGRNEYGELGDGTNTERETPEPILGLSGVSALSEGYYSTAALMANGTVEDWGYGGYGELGVGSTEEHHSPVTVPGVEHAVQITSGCYATYALLSNGTVMAWGYNDDGELGDGTNTERKSPVPVPGLEQVVAISAGCDSALALLSNGTVMAWGYNGYGELGDGTLEERKSPVAVSGVSNVTAIAAGGDFGLALTASGTVDGWGYNYYHELGDGTNEERKTAEQIPGVTNVAQIAAGGYYSLALLSDGAVEGWGFAEDGELGSGTNLEQGTHLLLPFPNAAIGLATGGGGGESYTSLVIEGARGRVSNTSLAFAAQAAGTTSGAQSLTVTNEGPASLPISGDALSGAGAGAFHKTADGCQGTTLVAGASCTISLAFAPGAGGEAAATMSISSSAVGGLSPIALSGTGVAVTAPVAPSLGALALSPSTFRVAHSGVSADAASAATGTFVVYTDTEAATATFLVEQKSHGVVSHGKCGAAPKHPKKGAKRCSFYKQLGSFTHADTVGTDALRFTGRVAGRSLAAGSYRLSASSHGAGGTSTKRTATFTVTH
jgi:alpha-tubulin suppressor-like RCC1 family protein